MALRAISHFVELRNIYDNEHNVLADRVLMDMAIAPKTSLVFIAARQETQNDQNHFIYTAIFLKAEYPRFCANKLKEALKKRVKACVYHTVDASVTLLKEGNETHRCVIYIYYPDDDEILLEKMRQFWKDMQQKAQLEEKIEEITSYPGCMTVE